MTIYDELDLLDQAEAEADELAGELDLYGVGRREFVKLLTVATAVRSCLLP